MSDSQSAERPGEAFARKLLSGNMPLAVGSVDVGEFQNALLGSERWNYIEKIGWDKWLGQLREFQVRMDDLNQMAPFDQPVMDHLIEEVGRYEAAKIQDQSYQQLLALGREGWLQTKREMLYWAACTADREANLQWVQILSAGAVISEQDWWRYGVSFLYRAPGLLIPSQIGMLRYAPEILGKPINLTQFTREEIDYGPEIDETKFRL